MTKKSTRPPKRILYIITKSVWGGAAKYVYDLATSLSKENFEVFIASGPAPKKARYGKDNQGKFAEEIKKANLPYFEIHNFQRSVNPFKDIFAFFEILILLFKIKPDIIHVNSPKAGGITGIAASIYKVLHKLQTTNYKLQTIYTPHGWAIKEDRPKWQVFLIKLFSKLTCLFYDKIICVSEYDKNIAIQNNIAPAHKITTIHVSISPKNISFLLREEAQKKLLNGKTSPFIIGTIAEWNKNKGLFYLLEAALEFKRKLDNKQANAWSPISELDIILIGSGENADKEKMYDFVKNHNLENVHLIEWIDNAAAYLNGFDIFILPSIKEGFPYSILEAMAAQLPIITTPVGGIPEVIENNVNGILVQPKNSHELALKILYLINNPAIGREMARKAREKVEKEFSLEKMIKETKKVYQSFLNFPAKTS